MRNEALFDKKIWGLATARIEGSGQLSPLPFLFGQIREREREQPPHILTLLGIHLQDDNRKTPAHAPPPT